MALRCQSALLALFVLGAMAGCHRSSTQAAPLEEASVQDAGQARVPIRRPRPHQPREVPDDSTGPIITNH